MMCAACGTEIADKALICYRCGAATDAPAPVGRAGGADRRRCVRWVLAALAAVAAAATAWLLW